MPYPNEHACRVRSPAQFEKNSFRRLKKGKISIIIGKLKGKSTTTTQAYRYPKSAYSEAQARQHCKEHNGSFEPASKSTQEMNPFIKTIDEKE